MVARFLALLVTVGITCGSLIVDPSELLIGDNKPHHVIFSCRELIEGKLRRVEENVIWMKDGEVLAKSLKYRIKGKKRQLRINMIEVADTGIYTCAVEDDPSHKTATAALYVKPEVSANSTQNLVVGFDGIISCNVLSTGVDSIQWKFNNEHLILWKPINKEARDRGRYSAYRNGSLGISKIHITDDGDYQCIGVNKAGKTSVNITLNAVWPIAPVPQPPGNCKRIKRETEVEEKSDTEQQHEEYLTKNKRAYYVDETFLYLLRWQHSPVFVEAPPVCIKVWVKQELILPCRAVSYPRAKITWRKATGIIRKEDLWTGRITITRERLRIRRVQRNDQSTYTCKAENRFGTQEYQVRVKVYDIKEMCGKPIESRRKRIVQGSPVSSIGTWPWQVLIEYNPSVWSNREAFCGGTIIDAKRIVTALHCVLNSNQLFSLSDIIVRVGLYNRTVNRERSQQILNVSRIYTPAAFSITSDLAILELKEPIFFTKTVRPLCLPGKHETLPIPGTECVVSGWGRVQTKGSNSDVLRKVSVPLVSWDDCKLQYDYLPDDAICAGSSSEGSGDACLSDSGGPLACRNNDDDKWVLVGVVSGGEGCGDGKYGYYANIFHNREWIENILDPPRNQYYSYPSSPSTPIIIPDHLVLNMIQ